MDWKELDQIGTRFIAYLEKVFREPRFLFVALETEDDAQRILQDAWGISELGAVGDEAVRILMLWRDAMDVPFRRQIQLRCTNSFSLLQPPGTTAARTLQDEFENVVRQGPGFVLDMVKRQLKRKRDAKGTQRADIERDQRAVYALQLAEVIREAYLPVTHQIEVLDDPNKAWGRIFGSRRSKTLRNRYKSWQRFRSWLVAYSGEVWPKSLTPLISYVEERIDDGCSFTCPSELHASLTILEQIGRVPDEKRFSSDTTWLSHLASWKLELETHARVPKAAKPYTVAILASLEIFVMDFQQDLYARFIAWVMLIASWTSLRVDDIQNLLPETLRLSRRGFSARLARTKTSGPGKVHGQLPVFIQREISLTGHDWLSTGFGFTQMDSFIYPRDYLVPYHNEHWTAFFPKLVEPPSLANFMRIVLGRLGTPRFQDEVWRANMAMLLAPGEMLLFWTGHSPRHFLTQAALSLGVTKERRDYLGRWSIGRVGSNSYIHSARQVVEEVQVEVLQALVKGTAVIDEGELLDEIAQFADEHGLIGHRIKRRHTQQFRRDTALVLPEEEESEAEEDVPPEGGSDAIVLEPRPEAAGNSDRAKFFVTVSRRGGIRRLHAHHRCPVKSERCLETYDLVDVDENSFDVMCRICKKRLQQDEGALKSDSSSTSGDSSSTDSE